MDTLRNALDAQLKAAVDLEQFITEVQSMPKVIRYESSVQSELLSIQSKRRHMELRLEQLIVDLTDGLIDKDEYAYAKKRYNDEYEHLLEEENRVFASSKKLGNIVASSNKWIQFVKEYRAIPDVDRKAVEYLVKRINIYPDKRIQIILNYEDPFRLISEYIEEIPEVLADVG